jgi:hypothetical protein
LLQLRSFEELGSGTEVPILPAGHALGGQNFVAFPECPKGLAPVLAEPNTTPFPRFSKFLFPEAILRGFRLYSIGSAFFNDLSLVDQVPAQKDFAGRINFGFSEGFRYDKAADTVEASAPTRTVDCEGCPVIGSNEPASFGSWLFRILPKLVLLRQAESVDRVMVFTGRPWIAAWLRAIAPDIEMIPHALDQTYELINPAVPSLPAPDGFHRREIQEALEPVIDRARRAMPSTPEKVYISRRKMALLLPDHRIFENETELVERLASHGFLEFIPEDKTPIEQIAVCSNARVIVSPGGSNLFCCYFARRAELIVDIESGDTFLEHHGNVLASCGRPYSIVQGVQTGRGRHPHHMNFTIDVEAFMAGLGKLGALV